MRRQESRSAVLARAQAHLAGRRGAARGAQVTSRPAFEKLQDWGPGRRLPTAGTTTSSSSSSSHGLPVLRMASDLSDLSDAASSSSSRPGGQKPAEGLSLGETTPPPRPHSRFLKQKTQKAPADVRPAGLDPAARVGRSAAPAARPSALLKKLAQIEDKIRSREPGRDVTRTVSVLDEETSVSESVRDSQPRAEGLKYLKRKARPREVGPRDADGEERHGRGAATESRAQQGLPGATLGGKVPSPARLRPSLPAQSSLKMPPHRSPSPASSSALPPRVPSPPTASRSLSSIGPRGRSPPEHSLVRSLDELFSEAAGTPREASGSSSSSDFRVNIFSLEDLAPSPASPKEGREAKATTAKAAGKPTKGLGAAPAPAGVARSPFAAPKFSVGEAATQEEEEEEEDPGETEISERLSCSSAGPFAGEEEEAPQQCRVFGGPCSAEYSEGPSSAEYSEGPSSAEYSEDFEPTASSAASEGTRPPSSSEESGGPWDASEQSSPTEASSLGRPMQGLGSTAPSLRRIAVTDAAVQTNGSSLAYHWLQTGVPVTLGQAEGGSAVEGAPVASHVLSLDVVEALTTYSPAVFALNDLLKQNVLLIRQFVEASRRLHASFVASLEEEDFHYHSLEEAKRYIDRHKPRPLTLEQALQRVEEQRRWE
ncbi:uncharacterized protein C19orf44 homolog [Elgaria multicarinata webbii]|uniref:uncharacterized protein C19orf44 homolog n=1 Tax=Elgaria multicarinata webbii TaxID=159646 RepID=UPI002FCD4559